MFEFAEISFDEVALSVDHAVDRALYLPIALCRDVGGGAHGLDLLDERAGIIAAIGDEVAQAPQTGDQVGGGGMVGELALRHGKADRQSLGIDHCVDLGAQSPTRETDGVIRAPFLPPLAC